MSCETSLSAALIEGRLPADMEKRCVGHLVLSRTARAYHWLVFFLMRKLHLQFRTGSLSRRCPRYLPKVAQAIADVLTNAARFCNTKGDLVAWQNFVSDLDNRLFVVGTRSHLSFGVACSTFVIFFEDLVSKIQSCLCTRCLPVKFLRILQ